MAKQPSLEHQYTCGAVCAALRTWSEETGLGLAVSAPGVIFADDDNVAPDVVWLSRARLRTALGEDRKLHQAPELVVEVLSPGPANERRDREAKLKLYSRREVGEYWIVDGQQRLVDVYRKEGPALRLAATVTGHDRLESPLLPGFSVPVSRLFLPEDMSPRQFVGATPGGWPVGGPRRPGRAPGSHPRRSVTVILRGGAAAPAFS